MMVVGVSLLLCAAIGVFRMTASDARYSLVVPVADDVWILYPRKDSLIGISRLEADLERGPIAAQSIYTLIWAKRP